MTDHRQLLHARYHPSIKTFTYEIRVARTIRNETSFTDPRLCARVALDRARTDYASEEDVEIRIMYGGIVVESRRK